MQRETYKLKNEEATTLLTVLNDALVEYRRNLKSCEELNLKPEVAFWQRRIDDASVIVNLFLPADEILTCKLTPEGL